MLLPVSWAQLTPADALPFPAETTPNAQARDASAFHLSNRQVASQAESGGSEPLRDDQAMMS
jgi:hypothetical protein